MDKFNNDLRQANSGLADLEDEFDQQAPVGRDEDVVDAQKQEAAAFRQQLEDQKDVIDNLDGQCQDLIDNGFILLRQYQSGWV